MNQVRILLTLIEFLLQSQYYCDTASSRTRISGNDLPDIGLVVSVKILSEIYKIKD
jgi:hypothetical protein